MEARALEVLDKEVLEDLTKAYRDMVSGFSKLYECLTIVESKLHIFWHICHSHTAYVEKGVGIDFFLDIAASWMATTCWT